MIPVAVLRRHRLEAEWRSRLELARSRYQAATLESRRLLDETPERPHPDAASELSRDPRKQAEARSEYIRVLKIFSRLSIEGELPENESEANLIVVIDDDESVRDSVKAFLRSAGHSVETFESAETFLQSGAAAETGCLILDVRMPGMKGPELQVQLSAGDFRIPIIFITAHYDNELHRRVVQAGAVEILRKPFAPSALLSLVESAIGRHTDGK